MYCRKYNIALSNIGRMGIDTILSVVSLFLLRSNNSTTQTSQQQMQQSNRIHSGAWTILLPLLQVLNSLEVLVF